MPKGKSAPSIPLSGSINKLAKLPSHHLSPAWSPSNDTLLAIVSEKKPAAVASTTRHRAIKISPHGPTGGGGWVIIAILSRCQKNELRPSEPLSGLILGLVRVRLGGAYALQLIDPGLPLVVGLFQSMLLHLLAHGVDLMV